MRRALIYATFDGVCTNYHGIGTQTQSFMRYVAADSTQVHKHVEDLFLAYPEPRPGVIGYQVDHELLEVSEELCRQGGVVGWPLTFGAGILWRNATWRELCDSLATRIADVLPRYDQIVVIAVDAIFTLLTEYLDAKVGRAGWGQVRVVHALYSSGRIKGMAPVDGVDELRKRIESEQCCIDRANSDSRVDLADVDEFFTAHLRDSYGLRKRGLRFRQSLSLTSPDFAELDEGQAEEELRDHALPGDLPIVLFAGRTDPVKGLDLLVEAARSITVPFRLVAIAVPYRAGDPNLINIERMLADVDYPYVLVPHHDRLLLRALASTESCKVVACPSRGEPIGTLPQEVALWAKRGGPVVVASDCDGYAQQITHGENGLLFTPSDVGSMAEEITRALTMSSADNAEMRSRAYLRVMRERDFGRNFAELLVDLEWD
ncbi:Glycosyl transferases group 1 [Amycolatopsis tolypomycina]|uniref:Glycosyl transferases group 1 n=2 Tax=Amycolatopsis tolypomycina TaxID=208445 RepID=A0A1H4YUR9_9PSEU|nr:Glycosyl transferases group 1 [Amycolatopsis tolypomycina]